MSKPHLIPISLFAAFACSSLLAQTPSERNAMRDLLKATEAASKGHYASAVGMYKRIVRKYPGTGAAMLASERSQPTAFLGSGVVVRNGPSANRLDIVVMGDGYRLSDQNEFDDVAKSIPKLFKNHKLLGEYFGYHNFLRANLRSKDAGVNGFGRTYDTALGGFIAGKVQGQVGINAGKVRRFLAEVDDNDGLVIAIVKAGSMGTGGGGIACIGGRADKTIIHEWGHAFGGLSDEYTAFTGHRGPPRSTVNISRFKDPKRAPWYHFIEKKYPGVGTYRGGDGRIKGVWRPTASGCVMGGGGKFCPVCRESIVKRIYRHVDPIDACTPPLDKRLKGRSKFKFSVTLMKPKTHNLSISWYVLSGNQLIRPAKTGALKDRRRRGKLAAIKVKSKKYLPNSGRAKQGFLFEAKDLPAGKYQVVCRVQDRAKPSGQQRSWVLKDPDQLLWSERVWSIDVR